MVTSPNLKSDQIIHAASPPQVFTYISNSDIVLPFAYVYIRRMFMDNWSAIGIYQIRNLINDKRYVGSTSTSFARRWQQHLNLLLQGKHHCKHLQNSWNKYGAEAFAYEII